MFQCNCSLGQCKKQLQIICMIQKWVWRITLLNCKWLCASSSLRGGQAYACNHWMCHYWLFLIQAPLLCSGLFCSFVLLWSELFTTWSVQIHWYIWYNTQIALGTRNFEYHPFPFAVPVAVLTLPISINPDGWWWPLFVLQWKTTYLHNDSRAS